MNLTDKLIGTWKLISYELPNTDNTTYYPFGIDCEGYLIYTKDGYVSAQLMRKGRSKYASGLLHDGTTEEMAEAAHGYMAYTGTYCIDESTMSVVHNIELSMNPTWAYQSQIRRISLCEDILTITADINHATLIWKKVTSI